MEFELTTQSVMYSFGNNKYKNGLANKTYPHVGKKATPDQINEVGKAIAELQDDSLDDVLLIQKHRVVQNRG